MGTGSQCLPIAREPENLTIPGHGGGPGRVPCAIHAHPVQPLLRLFAGEGGEGVIRCTFTRSASASDGAVARELCAPPPARRSPNRWLSGLYSVGERALVTAPYAAGDLKRRGRHLSLGHRPAVSRFQVCCSAHATNRSAMHWRASPVCAYAKRR
jgi:hypothetical protein